jgi:SAM-dependent methyltransferase
MSFLCPSDLAPQLLLFTLGVLNMMTSNCAWNQIWNLSNVTGTYGYTPSRWRRADDKVGYWIQSGIEFSEGERILEAGCGDAAILIRLMKLFNVHGTGVDFAESAITQAKLLAHQENCKADFNRADICELPLESNQFDKVISLGVVEHMPDLEPSLKEMKRVLRPGGLMILMTPNRYSFGRWQRLAACATGRWPYGYQDEYSPSELASAVSAVGLRVVKSEAVLRRRMDFEPAPLRWIRRLDSAMAAAVPSWGFYSYVFASK